MLIKSEIALAVAILLGAAAAAPAATKNGRNAVHHRASHSAPYGQVAVPQYPQAADPDTPAAAGGGSLGYNRIQYDDW